MQTLEPLTRDFFKELFPFTENAFSALNRILKHVSIPRNQVFIKADRKNNSEYILASGYCRSFLLNMEGEETTLAFYKSKSVLPPHIIRTRDSVSLLNFQALTDVTLVEFDAGHFLSLMIEDLEIREFGNSVLLNELVRKTEKEIDLVTQTAKARLKKFRSEYSMLENLIPHPFIASYLGITNVSLSRLRHDSQE